MKISFTCIMLNSWGPMSMTVSLWKKSSKVKKVKTKEERKQCDVLRG